MQDPNDLSYEASKVILIIGLFAMGGGMLFLNPEFSEFYRANFPWLHWKAVPLISGGVATVLLLPTILMKEAWKGTIQTEMRE